jgi:4-hydroxy-2-oxoheptanedioate aldolase
VRPNAVAASISAGRTVVNGWLSSGSAYAAEVLSHAGFDSVTVDAQHGMFGRDEVVGLLQAISCGPAVPFARPSVCDPAEIGWLLDAGAYGVVVPSVDTPALARLVVDACRYPPHGRRSFGASRGLLYGGPDYVAEAGATVMAWAMVESRSAVDHLDEIAATPGLAGLYLGPNDLALDLGLVPGGRIGDEVAVVARRLVAVCHAHGIAAGLFCADGEEAAYWADAGFDLVTPGNDVSLLRSGAAARIAAVRSPAGSVPSGRTTSGY